MDLEAERIATINLYRHLPGLHCHALARRLGIPEERMRRYIGYPPLQPKEIPENLKFRDENRIPRTCCPRCGCTRYQKHGNWNGIPVCECLRCGRYYLESVSRQAAVIVAASCKP